VGEVFRLADLGDLMAQHEELDVLGGGRVIRQQDQLEHRQKIKYANRNDTAGSCPTTDHRRSARQARLLAPHKVRPTRPLCSPQPEVRCDPAEVGTLAPGQEPHSRRDASVVQQPRANGLRCDLRDEDGDAVGCGPQKSGDPADGVGGRDRLREDQPHNERDEQEPDESPHRPPPFRAGRGER